MFKVKKGTKALYALILAVILTVACTVVPTYTYAGESTYNEETESDAVNNQENEDTNEKDSVSKCDLSLMLTTEAGKNGDKNWWKQSHITGTSNFRLKLFNADNTPVTGEFTVIIQDRTGKTKKETMKATESYGITGLELGEGSTITVKGLQEGMRYELMSVYDPSVIYYIPLTEGATGIVEKSKQHSKNYVVYETSVKTWTIRNTVTNSDNDPASDRFEFPVEIRFSGSNGISLPEEIKYYKTKKDGTKEEGVLKLSYGYYDRNTDGSLKQLTTMISISDGETVEIPNIPTSFTYCCNYEWGKTITEDRWINFFTKQEVEAMKHARAYMYSDDNNRGALEIYDDNSGALRNTRRLTNLSIYKYFTTQGDSNREFTYKINIKDYDGTPLTGKYEAEIKGNRTTVEFNENGEAEVKVTGVSRCIIYDLPCGVTYCVTEEDDSEYRSCETHLEGPGDYSKVSKNSTGEQILGMQGDSLDEMKVMFYGEFGLNDNVASSETDVKSESDGTDSAIKSSTSAYTKESTTKRVTYKTRSQDNSNTEAMGRDDDTDTEDNTDKSTTKTEEKSESSSNGDNVTETIKTTESPPDTEKMTEDTKEEATTTETESSKQKEKVIVIDDTGPSDG